MSKKLITACMALFALAAFALSATASASPVLTHPTGTAAALGTKLTGTNIGNTILRSGTTILSECTKATLTGELTKNNGAVIEGNVTTATFTGTGGQDPAEAEKMPECTGTGLGNTTVTTNGGGIDENTVPNGTPWCMKSTALKTFTVRGGLCSQEERLLEFIMKSTSFGTCVYQRAKGSPITGTYTTDETGDAVFSLTPEGTEFKKNTEKSGVLCPEKGSLEMSFTMETDIGPESSPVWIS